MSKTFYCDYTMISAFLRCRLYYYYRHVKHLVPIITAAPLSFGSAWHLATEVLAKGQLLEEAQKLFKEKYKNETNNEIRTPEKGSSMLALYAKKYEKAPIKVLYTETPFALSFPNDIIMCGRIDAIVEWSDGIYVLERKTTGQMGATFFEQFSMNYQVDIYCLACLEIMGKCNGAIIDAVRVCKPPSKMEVDFVRDITSRTTAELADAKENLVTVIEDMQTGPMYQSKANCMYYGKCTYWDVCMSRGNERVIKGFYKEEVWDPTHNIKKDAFDQQLVLF